MPSVSSSRIMPYSAEKVFAVVMDIESYPQVLSFVRGITILSRSSRSITARAQVGLPLLNFSYDCRIDFEPARKIDIHLLSGPFRKLEASWRFEPLDDNRTHITYSLDAQFSSRLMDATAGALFASQLHHSIAVFEERLRRA